MSATPPEYTNNCDIDETRLTAQVRISSVSARMHVLQAWKHMRGGLGGAPSGLRQLRSCSRRHTCRRGTAPTLAYATPQPCKRLRQVRCCVGFHSVGSSAVRCDLEACVPREVLRCCVDAIDSLAHIWRKLACQSHSAVSVRRAHARGATQLTHASLVQDNGGIPPAASARARSAILSRCHGRPADTDSYSPEYSVSPANADALSTRRCYSRCAL